MTNKPIIGRLRCLRCGGKAREIVIQPAGITVWLCIGDGKADKDGRYTACKGGIHIWWPKDYDPPRVTKEEEVQPVWFNRLEKENPHGHKTGNGHRNTRNF